MKSYRVLPEDYKKWFSIDLQEDTKLAWRLNVIGAGCLVGAVIAGLIFEPKPWRIGILPILTLVLGTMVYIVLHEVVHGIFMYLFSRVKPKFGLTALYAYAGSEVYFCRFHYIVIALAPVVILGIFLLSLCVKTYGTRWFWPVYFIEVYNLCGAIGDYYVTWKFLGMKKKILVLDTGYSMTVYTKEY